MLVLIFFLIFQVSDKMKASKVSYQNIKHKMKFGNQELPILTNKFHHPSREASQQVNIFLSPPRFERLIFYLRGAIKKICSNLNE